MPDVTQLQERMQALNIKASLAKMNTCHSQADGKFCSGGGKGKGGGMQDLSDKKTRQAIDRAIDRGEADSPIPSLKETKAMAKQLSLPSGPTAKFTEGAYSWRQDGGSSKDIFSSVAAAAKKANFTQQATKHSNGLSTDVYTDGRWSLTTRQLYTSNSSKNFFSISLKHKL